MDSPSCLKSLPRNQSVRLNNTSCQVYIGLKKGTTIPESVGDLIFTSESEKFSTDEIADFHTKSRTFSIYYPDTRPDRKEPRYSIVASLNAKWKDWDELSDSDYRRAKDRLCEESLIALEKLIPGIRSKVDHIEAATPRTIKYYTKHASGATFGTKFEGLEVSNELPNYAPGLFHAGSVGIIMSGWLGTINYGVITANKIDSFLRVNPLRKMIKTRVTQPLPLPEVHPFSSNLSIIMEDIYRRILIALLFIYR